MSVTPHSAPGTGLVFASNTFTVTNITINFAETGNLIDISHLGQTAGNVALSMRPPLIDAQATGREVSFDYIGTTQLVGGVSGAFSMTGPVAITNGTGTITSSTLTLAVNDVIRGSATLRYVV